MERYLVGTDAIKSAIKEEGFDVIVVGGGLAGLYSSLHINSDRKVAVMMKGSIEKGGSSWYAQGGIAAVLDGNDSTEMLVDDTLRAGAGLCDINAVETLVREGPENIRELTEMGVPFDTDSDGELLITREGGHHRNRIVHCGGDATGRETTKRLGQIVEKRENITVMTNHYLVDVITDDDGVRGVLVYCDDKRLHYYPASYVIIATGGIGQIYRYTTNPQGCDGDGIAAAKRAGAIVSNMEMVQFHPTTLMPQGKTDRLFLISEAVRGEGGILRNKDGVAFMQNVHEMKDLAPRDIVTRAILAELSKNGGTNVYLDVSSMTKEAFAKRFPTIYAKCTESGIDLTKEPIPVRPGQHYLMGGIKTDLDGRTNIEGLYACGEAACTGVHGANRLASNSMMECLVFGRRCAKNINMSKRSFRESLPDVGEEVHGTKPIDHTRVSELRTRIKHRMTSYVGPIRTVDGLKKARELITEINDEIEEYNVSDRYEFELKNIAQVAEIVIDSAISRHESVGAHYIADNVVTARKDPGQIDKDMLDDFIRSTLAEDVGSGDITTDAIISASKKATGRLTAKAGGVFCGSDVLRRIFGVIFDDTEVELYVKDGDVVTKGQLLATVTGNARKILSGERTAINIVQHLSGIATMTNELVKTVAGTGVHITDTRKTTPGMRFLEKYAVRVGGGYSHRFNLSDGILIKDNHINAAGGIENAVRLARENASHLLKIEVEVENIEDMHTAIDAGADVVMLDNMDIETMRRAVKAAAGRVKLEASGNMYERDIREVAETGVDLISVGALTHSIKALDISMKIGLD